MGLIDDAIYTDEWCEEQAEELDDECLVESLSC